MFNRFPRLSRGLSLGFLTTALLGAPGCGSDSTDLDLNTILEASEDDKADQPQGTSALTWTRVSSSMLNCIKAPCPSTILNDVNAGVTQFVYQLDWRALKLSKADQTKAEGQASKMLLYGRYTPVKVQGEPLRIFQITRAHERVSESAADRPDADRYYRVQIADHECMQPPCTGDWKATLLLMGAQPELWKSIDLSALQLLPGTEQPLVDELKTGQDYLSVSDVADLSAKATQAFRPIKSKQL